MFCFVLLVGACFEDALSVTAGALSRPALLMMVLSFVIG